MPSSASVRPSHRRTVARSSKRCRSWSSPKRSTPAWDDRRAGAATSNARRGGGRVELRLKLNLCLHHFGCRLLRDFTCLPSGTVQDFRSKTRKKIIKEMLLFRPFYSIVTIASKKKNKLLVHVSSESELKPSLFLIILDCTKREEKDEKL